MTIRKGYPVKEGFELIASIVGDENESSVILAHGGGQTRHAWGGTAQALADRGWHTISYDHRGHGESGWSPEGNYTLEEFAADLTLIAQSCLKPPVVIGASLGGLSAILAQGESSKAIFSDIILVDITPNMNRSGVQNIMNFMAERMDEGFSSLEEAAEIIAAYTKRSRPPSLDGLKKNLRQIDGRWYWHWDPRIMNLRNDPTNNPGRLVRAARNLQQPVLLVRGQLSDLVTEVEAREFLEMVPHADYVDVEHARHMVAGDRNDIFTEAVLDFLCK